MLFLQLFGTFLLIGAFTFGGGYSMIALIHNEVVLRHHWLSADQFTDILAVSQMTPGPIGINTATFAGYTAVINAGYPQWAAVAGSLLASLSVIIIPVALMMLLGTWLLKHKSQPSVAAVMRLLRLVVIGLIAAAALQLMPAVFSTTPVGNLTIFDTQFSIINILIFAAVFLLSFFRKASPILLIVCSGIVGLVVYSIFPL